MTVMDVRTGDDGSISNDRSHDSPNWRNTHEGTEYPFEGLTGNAPLTEIGADRHEGKISIFILNYIYTDRIQGGPI